MSKKHKRRHHKRPLAAQPATSPKAVPSTADLAIASQIETPNFTPERTLPELASVRYLPVISRELIGIGLVFGFLTVLLLILTLTPTQQVLSTTLSDYLTRALHIQ